MIYVYFQQTNSNSFSSSMFLLNTTPETPDFLQAPQTGSWGWKLILFVFPPKYGLLIKLFSPVLTTTLSHCFLYMRSRNCTTTLQSSRKIFPCLLNTGACIMSAGLSTQIISSTLILFFFTYIRELISTFM